MNVGQLRKALEGVDDDVLLVVPGSDHSYREARVQQDKAEVFEGGYLGEYFGEEYASEDRLSVKPVLVVGR